MELWQLITAAVVVSLDAIVFTTCLFLTCKIYNDLRSVLYSQFGLLGQPLLMAQQQGGAQQRQPGQEQSQQPANGSQQQSFTPFQGRPLRIVPEAV